MAVLWLSGVPSGTHPCLSSLMAPSPYSAWGVLGPSGEGILEGPAQSWRTVVPARALGQAGRGRGGACGPGRYSGACRGGAWALWGRRGLGPESCGRERPLLPVALCPSSRAPPYLECPREPRCWSLGVHRDSACGVGSRRSGPLRSGRPRPGRPGAAGVPTARQCTERELAWRRRPDPASWIRICLFNLDINIPT